jgi:nitrogen fixation-related uncharacterized protein
MSRILYILYIFLWGLTNNVTYIVYFIHIFVRSQIMSRILYVLYIFLWGLTNSTYIVHFRHCCEVSQIMSRILYILYIFLWGLTNNVTYIVHFRHFCEVSQIMSRILYIIHMTLFVRCHKNFYTLLPWIFKFLYRTPDDDRMTETCSEWVIIKCRSCRTERMVLFKSRLTARWITSKREDYNRWKVGNCLQVDKVRHILPADLNLHQKCCFSRLWWTSPLQWRLQPTTWLFLCWGYGLTDVTDSQCHILSKWKNT